jgi:hypothetical protein
VHQAVSQAWFYKDGSTRVKTECTVSEEQKENTGLIAVKMRQTVLIHCSQLRIDEDIHILVCQYQSSLTDIAESN